MKDELMNVKIKFTEQSQLVAELKQEISQLETKVRNHKQTVLFGCISQQFVYISVQTEFRNVGRR